jgi:hypothetical protein
LVSASYCTEILSNGEEILHTQTAATCTYNTVEPTSSTTSLTAASTTTSTPSTTTGEAPINTDLGILTSGSPMYLWTDITLGDLGHVVNQFCYNMTQNVPPVVFEPGSSTRMAGNYTGADNEKYPI